MADLVVTQADLAQVYQGLYRPGNKRIAVDGYTVLDGLDLTLPSLFPAAWAGELAAAAALRGRKVEKKGRGPGSLEGDETAGLDYRVLTMSGIKDACPWLYILYQSPLLRAVVAHEVGEPVDIAQDEWALNVNLLLGGGGRYEWHVDGQPYTLLLYPETFSHEEGGALLLAPGINPDGTTRQLADYTHRYAQKKIGGRAERIDHYPNWVQTVRPVAGRCVIFDGSRIPHAVEPVFVERSRVSVPMVYLPATAAAAAAAAAGRDDTLSGYLYAEQEQEAEPEGDA